MFKRTSLLLLSVWLVIPSVHSDEINVSGFASLVAGVTMGSDETYLGYTDDIDFDNHSLLGIQFSKDIGDGWGVTTQLLSKGANQWDVDVSWAFVSYETDNSRTLFGRQRIPQFLYSDFLDVSYAYHWITPPDALYDLFFDTIDGVGYIYNSTLGEFDSTIHAVYGNNTFDTGDITVDIEGLVTVAWTLNKDWLTLRFSYTDTDFDAPVPDLDGLAAAWAAAGFANVGDSLTFRDDTSTSYDVGAMIDYENWLFAVEFIDSDTGDNTMGERDAYFVTLGYRTDVGMFHVTYSAEEHDADFSSLANVPQGVDPGLDQLYAATFGIHAGSAIDSDELTVGWKKDFDTTISLKVEYSMFSNNLPNTNDADLLRVGLVAVF